MTFFQIKYTFESLYIVRQQTINCLKIGSNSGKIEFIFITKQIYIFGLFNLK